MSNEFLFLLGTHQNQSLAIVWTCLEPIFGPVIITPRVIKEFFVVAN